MIIRITKDVLLDVLILSGMVLVFHPQRNGEILGKIMRHHFRRDRGACWSVKHENLRNIIRDKRLLHAPL